MTLGNPRPVRLNTVQPPAAVSEQPKIAERDFAAALLSVGGVANRNMVCRAQRLVREQSIELAEQRRRARHAVGLTILGFSLLLLVLTPVVWSSFHLANGWNLKGYETLLMCTIGWLFPVTLIGLVLAFPRMRANRGARRLDHRLDSRLGSIVR